jgi:hypothetical protein
MGMEVGRIPWLAVAGALALTPGCRQEQISHYRVAKQAPPAEVAAAPDPGAMAPAHGAPTPSPAPVPQGGPMAGQVDAPPMPTGSSALRWTLPKGWTEAPPGAMRFATLKTPPAITGRIDASVVVLPGPAGGELANVNRWRGQIGLPATDEASLARSRTTVQSKAGTVNVYDFTSEGTKKSRLVAGILLVDGSSWFVKLTGDAEPVAAARSDFLRILESLRLDR